MRSGTSALAGSLKLLGWHVPIPEVPASPRNVRGHFESRWVIEFHKRLLRQALVRPSDGSPLATSRVEEAVQEAAAADELRDWLMAQDQPQVVVKDPHAGWLLGTWRLAATEAGRDLRTLTALRHPAAVVGSQDLTWGGRRDDEERRVKETSNTAAWLNVALTAERGSREGARSFIRYDDLLTDWRSALGRVSDQLRLGLALDPDRAGHELDSWLDTDLRHSTVTWQDIVVPGWLRDLAQDAWDQFDVLVERPDDEDARARLDDIRLAYDTHYAEAVAVSLDEARHRERRGARAGAAKVRVRLRNERALRQAMQARLDSAGRDDGAPERARRGRAWLHAWGQRP
jgi:hypothetical protein